MTTLKKIMKEFWNVFDKEVEMNGDDGNGEIEAVRSIIKSLFEEFERTEWDYDTCKLIVNKILKEKLS